LCHGNLENAVAFPSGEIGEHGERELVIRVVESFVRPRNGIAYDVVLESGWTGAAEHGDDDRDAQKVQ
jgi:hypothetical protein